MRIGLNCMLLAGNYSGVEQSIWRLALALRQIDAHNEYVVYTAADTETGPLEGDRWRIHRAPFKGRRKTLRIMWEQFRLPGRSFQDDLDLLHCPGYLIPSMLLKPSVATIHDVIALKRPDLARRANVKHFKLRLPKTVARATRIIVPSRATRDDVVEILACDPAKIHIVPMGVGEEFQPITDADLLAGARREMGLPERFVLFVGNREPKKNIAKIIEALYAAIQNAAYLAGRGQGKLIPHKLVLVGARGWGDVDRRLTQIVRELSFEDHVFRTDYLPQQALPYVYNLADAFVFPSLIEGFGMPVLEAMACGTPVICSRDPALLETVGEAALTVPADDRPALREALEKVLTDETIARDLRARGFKRAQQFSWQRTARETLAVYHETVRAYDEIGREREA